MAVEIRKIGTKSEIKRFIQFANELYKDCPYYCPPLLFDEINTFDRKKNPVMEFSDYQLFMAYRDGQAVGRIAALVNHKANEAWGYKRVRFGWMDFIDDKEVSKALLDAVKQWGLERGMTEMNGPVGFTDWMVAMVGFSVISCLCERCESLMVRMTTEARNRSIMPILVILRVVAINVCR